MVRREEGQKAEVPKVIYGTSPNLAATYGDAVYAGAGGGRGAAAGGESGAAEFDSWYRGGSADYGAAQFGVDRGTRRGESC